MPVAETVVELHFEDAGGHVRIVPPDRDLMTMPVKTAIEACRAFNDQLTFRDQFDLLLEKLGQWLSDRRTAVADAYVTTRDAGLLFVVIQQEKNRDPELDEALTDLDLEIANDEDFSHIPLSVLALPHVDQASIRSFLTKELAFRLRFHGE